MKGEEGAYMFCSHCGQELKDGGRFCPRCGAPVEGAAQAEGSRTSENASTGPMQGGAQYGGAPGYQQAGPGVQMKRGMSQGAAIAIIVAIVLCIAGAGVGGYFLLFRNNYKTPIKNLMKAIEDQDGEAALKLIPEKYVEMAQTMSGMDKEDIEEMLEQGLDSMVEEYGGDIKVDYEIGDARDLTEAELADLEESYYGFLGDVEEGKEVEVSAEIQVDGSEKEEVMDDTLVKVIKLDGKWYLDPASMYF